MAKYNVLRPIEYDGKIYLPAADDAPQTARSASNGREIPVDSSGIIDLPEKQAAEMTQGQVKPASPPSAKPDRAKK
ncbi:MAG: hypothetical protein ACRD1N_00585 [Terriglobia bacterium]